MVSTATQSFISWYTNLYSSEREFLASVDFTQFKSADEILSHFHIQPSNQIVSAF